MKVKVRVYPETADQTVGERVGRKREGRIIQVDPKFYPEPENESSSRVLHFMYPPPDRCKPLLTYFRERVGVKKIQVRLGFARVQLIRLWGSE